MEAVFTHLRNEQFNNLSDYSSIGFSSQSSEYVSDHEQEDKISEKAVASITKVDAKRSSMVVENVPFEFCEGDSIEDETP